MNVGDFFIALMECNGSGIASYSISGATQKSSVGLSAGKYAVCEATSTSVTISAFTNNSWIIAVGAYKITAQSN